MRRNIGLYITCITALFFCTFHGTQTAFATSPETPAQKSVYRHVTLIDGTGDAPRSKMSVFVTGSHISNIVADQNVTAELLENTTVYNAANRYILPGLIDTHVHMATVPNQKIAHAYLKRHLYGGITTLRDMAGDARALADLSRAALIQEIAAPDLHYAALMAGPDFFSDPRTVASAMGSTPGKVPWMQGITRETDLALAVAQARGTSATGIKIYANLPGDLVRAIIAEADKQNMPVWTHLQVYPADPYDSLGATAVSHVCMIARYVGERDKQRYGHDDPPSYDGITAVHPEITKYIAALLKSGTIMDPTLSVYPIMSPDDNANETSSGPKCPRRLAAEITGAMHAAGIPISVGTDWIAERDNPFPMIIDELDSLVQHAGLSPHEAIVAATATASRVLGQGDRIGTLEKGKQANFLLLRESPVDDIKALRTIEMTVKRGHRYKRSDYQHAPIPDLPFPDQ